MNTTAPDYEVVIPTFNRPKPIAFLLDEIFVANAHKVPRRVIVVDDDSDPPQREALKEVIQKQRKQGRHIALMEGISQRGPYPCLRDGIDYATCNAVILCFDDVRLLYNPTDPKSLGSGMNPFLALAYYIEESQRLWLAQDDPEEEVGAPCGMMCPWVLRQRTPNIIHTAEVIIDSMERGLPLFETYPKSYFFFSEMRRIQQWQFYQMAFGNRFCYAINRTFYNEVGGFDEALDPYPYGNFDLSLKFREKGYTTRGTSLVAVFHRFRPYPKNVRSLTDNAQHGDIAERCTNSFIDKWGDRKLHQINRTLDVYRVETVETLNAPER